MKSLISAELARYRAKHTDLLPGDLARHMKAFCSGLWTAFRSLSALHVTESVAYNKKASADPDHWSPRRAARPPPRAADADGARRFELNTANVMLFDNLCLDSFPEVLPGRLFTTRMPRNIKADPSSAERFAEWIRPETGVIKALIEI